MKATLIGVCRSRGNYQGIDYDKLRFTFIVPYPSDSSDSAGSHALNPKMTSLKVSDVPSRCRDVSSFHDFYDLIGAEFDLSFDMYQNLDSLSLVK